MLARARRDQNLRSKFSDSDLVQETLIQAHRDLPSFRGCTEPEFAQWLRAIMTNKQALMARRYYGSPARDPRLEARLQDEFNESSEMLGRAIVDLQPSPSEHVAQREGAVLLADALASLPEHYHEVVVLRHIEGRKMREVADAMGRSVDSVKQALGARDDPAPRLDERSRMMNEHKPTSDDAPNATLDGKCKDRSARLEQAMEDVVRRLEEGDVLDRAALLTEYSDVADELSACLDNLEFVQQVAPQLSTESTSTKDEVARAGSPTNLGDFRIIREIGRGGMGVVYEAEQLSLGRRMALKVLPFAAMLDKQQQKRFKNEARAAATLDHPNIVAVHSVGEERGVHYYAMQLVEGQSLAEVIAQQKVEAGVQQHGDQSDAPTIEHRSSEPSARQSSHSGVEEERIPASETQPVAALSTVPNTNAHESFRSAAKLVMQAAQALDYAHQNGIVHRDVKPGNLLVDAEGKLYVTDFGLARIETEAGMTMTGDLLGTLAYMSPEQALAKRVVVDHRTDIYSLGVTLYELIILQKPYEGRDRQELLKKIAFDEPRRLRQINHRVPMDLDTIVAKAMEKNPDERYATAQELADDLRRFLADEAIQAKRPSLWKRTKRLASRHKMVTGAMAVGLILGATLFGAVTQQRHVKLRELNAAVGADMKSAHAAIDAKTYQLASEALSRAEARLEDNPLSPPDLLAEVRGWAD